MKKKRKFGRKLLSFLLALAMVVGMMPGMGLTAYAAPTETLLTTITATGKEQASYNPENVATVSFSYTANGSSSYMNNGKANWGWWGYGWTATVNPADGYTITKCVFYDDKDRTATDSKAPFVVETTEEDKTPQVNGTPILANQSKGITKIEVYGYATPTATHSVTITPGDHMTKTAGSGDAEQTGLTGAMTDVVYTANEGYYFPENYSVTAVNGISVTWDSYTQITVSGTPTADAAIVLTAPTAKTTPDAPTTATATDCTTADNNDGTLTGVTTAMEYKKSDAESWTVGTGSDITGLVPGTYYVRVKATDTTNASDNQELTVNAAQTPTETLLTTITPTGKTTHSATVDGVVTVLHNNDYYNGKYGWLWIENADTLTVSACEGYTITKCIFKQNEKSPVTDSSAPFELHFDSVGQWGGVQCRENSEFDGVTSIEVYGYATPTATHSVTITPGDNMTKTDASGATSQSDLSGAMTDVVYTADDGYYFPTDYGVATVNGISVTWDSYTQITVSGTPTADATITLTAPTAKTTPAAPTTAGAVDCTTSDNNDGKLTGVTTAMEYKKSDAESWTVGTGSDITGLVPGTYYVRVKATETTNASTNQELTIKGFISYTVTFKVVNGKWDEGEGDAATADKTVTLTGHDGDTLKLTADQIPTVGSKPNDTYKAGSWDTTPSAEIAITGATTYTYTYAQKDSNSQTVTFKVANGKWDDGTTADKTVTLTGYEGDALKLAASQIPTVGTKPNDTYKAGSWDTTPSAEIAITGATTYTYTYAQKDSNSQTVTFKVANGKWDDGTTADKTVTLTGYEGDALKLAASQIPTVGTKPNDTYKAGSWDTTPSAEIAITGATTYTYTYAQKDSISQTVTFKVVNGKWDDDSTADKTVTLTGYEGDTLKLAANQIPAVGTKPNDTYKAGSWDVTPSAEIAITGATTYTYTYAQKDSISQTVTFKVVNGSWNDETTTDKTVTLTGYEGDTLKLAAADIPAVGSKPSDTYKAGSWNVTPSTDTAITAATTYTYTYAAKEASVVTKAPTAKTLTYNGSAQELVTAGEASGGEMQYAIGTQDAATQPYTTSIPTKTDAGTYYVWYKAVGDETHTDSEAKCITVTISSESNGGGGGSSSSGGGSSTPSTPTTPTESYTVPVSSENTVNVTTNISNGTAVVSEITQSDIDKIVDNGNNSGGGDNTGASENTSITIDVSQAKSEVTSVQLSEKTVEKLTEAVKADNNVESVEIKMTNATIELDGAALSAVSEQAEGSSIKLVVEDTQTTKLNATQQESLKQFASAKPFQAYFESNGKEIHDFKGGKATVSIKFSPESGRDVKHYHMYYLPVAGAIERYVTRYVDGMLSFVTTHFSDYAIVYDETMENETGKDDGTGGGSSETGGESNGNTANGKTSYQNALSINKGLKVSQTGNKITVSWGKVSGADRYEIYAAYCTDKFGKKPVKIVTKKDVTSVTITKLNGKKLELTKNFKVYVAAYKTVDGVKKKLGKTITAHIVGRKNKTYTNVKAIKLVKNKTTIKVGKTYKIKASVVLVDSKKKMLSDKHAATFRYASSDKKIATVDKNGKVTAKKKGTCYVWIYAKNGYANKVKVTVK